MLTMTLGNKTFQLQSQWGNQPQADTAACASDSICASYSESLGFKCAQSPAMVFSRPKSSYPIHSPKVQIPYSLAKSPGTLFSRPKPSYPILSPEARLCWIFSLSSVLSGTFRESRDYLKLGHNSFVPRLSISIDLFERFGIQYSVNALNQTG
jgi:hypothetical protein